ncbi:MAG: S-adenosyl-methyltransferase MraW, rRNA (cytosine1402-N4)-methyltransferase [Candidatus Parcubacteria bacterium]|jgi:16S rRNA (cytosine1402-N4)-methyltransferase
MGHVPVLLNEVLLYLDPRPGTFVIDGTLDGGGHAEEILKRLRPRGTFLGVDLDPGMTEGFAKREAQSGIRIHVSQGNYADLPRIMREAGLPKADGLLVDLGFSSEQLSTSGRGFSFTKDEPLLMTYDPDAVPLRDLLAKVPERELADIIRELGGERMAGRVARAIVECRRKRSIATSGELADVVRSVLPKGYERGRIDPATRTFQALRIWANDELGNLSRLLAVLPDILAPGGRAVIISFHSAEDRLVKIAFAEGKKAERYDLLTKKPIIPTREEERQNPRSRSAKLRAIAFLK